MNHLHEFTKLVRELSYEKRQVTLASGRQSDFYIDMKNTLLHPKGIWLASQIIAEKIKVRRETQNIKGIGGLTMGADPISTGVSLVTHDWNQPLYSFYIRKEPKGHGTQQWLEGMKNFRTGDNVVIVEDVVTTGGSTLKSVERARLAGLEVIGVISTVDREEGGAENIVRENLWFEAVLTRQMILDFK
jgi:orotate phosphoribosyltransferase